MQALFRSRLLAIYSSRLALPTPDPTFEQLQSASETFRRHHDINDPNLVFLLPNKETRHLVSRPCFDRQVLDGFDQQQGQLQPVIWGYKKLRQVYQVHEETVCSKCPYQDTCRVANKVPSKKNLMVTNVMAVLNSAYSFPFLRDDDRNYLDLLKVANQLDALLQDMTQQAPHTKAFLNAAKPLEAMLLRAIVDKTKYIQHTEDKEQQGYKQNQSQEIKSDYQKHRNQNKETHRPENRQDRQGQKQEQDRGQYKNKQNREQNNKTHHKHQKQYQDKEQQASHYRKKNRGEYKENHRDEYRDNYQTVQREQHRNNQGHNKKRNGQNGYFQSNRTVQSKSDYQQYRQQEDKKEERRQEAGGRPRQEGQARGRKEVEGNGRQEEVSRGRQEEMNRGRHEEVSRGRHEEVSRGRQVRRSSFRK